MNGTARVSRSASVLLTIVVVLAILRYAQDVFMPLALAILLTFLLAPVVDRLQRLRVNRAVAVFVSVLVAVALIGTLLYVVFQQFTDLAQQLPHYRRQLRANLLELSGAVRGGMSKTTHAVEQLRKELQEVTPSVTELTTVRKVQVVAPPTDAMESLWNFVSSFLRPVGSAAVVILFVIFMLLRLADLRDRLIRLLGPRNLRVTTEALNDAAKRVSRYILMQTLINGCQGLIVASVLFALGVPNAVLWGALTLVLRFIPYVGSWVAAAMPLALSIAVFNNWTHPLEVLGLFVALELITNVVVEPWLYAGHTGVSPVALLVAALFWAWLWGPVGLFLAIPMTVCLVVMGKYIPQLSFLQVLLGDEPVLEPHERLYQRLLASNQDEMDELLEEALRSHSLMEVCDTVIVPAIELAEHDYDRGALQDSERQAILDRMTHWADELMDMRWRPAPSAQDSPMARVLCVPAADRADELIAKLFSALLLEKGLQVAVGGLNAEASAVDAVVISALPPEAVGPARTLCRRVRTNLGPLPLVVGLWHAHGDMLRARQRLESVGADYVVSSFAEGLAALQGGRQETRSPVTALIPERPTG